MGFPPPVSPPIPQEKVKNCKIKFKKMQNESENKELNVN